MTARKACFRCDGMLGPLQGDGDDKRGAHELCSKLTAEDWQALRPWFTGQLHSVHMGGE